ncbi:hypothetical protein PIB30_099284, partial [Stylosanthes scabra]|nr:hypothetical protein [Stylosanthes scabra]
MTIAIGGTMNLLVWSESHYEWNKMTEQDSFNCSERPTQQEVPPPAVPRASRGGPSSLKLRRAISSSEELYPR